MTKSDTDSIQILSDVIIYDNSYDGKVLPISVFNNNVYIIEVVLHYEILNWPFLICFHTYSYIFGYHSDILIFIWICWIQYYLYPYPTIFQTDWISDIHMSKVLWRIKYSYGIKYSSEYQIICIFYILATKKKCEHCALSWCFVGCQ